MDSVTMLSLGIALAATVVSVISLTIVRREGGSHNGQDVAAVVLEFAERSKRLEQEIVDQKVRTEVMEIRLEKLGETRNFALQPREPLWKGRGEDVLSKRRTIQEKRGEVRQQEEIEFPPVVERHEREVTGTPSESSTELEVLKIVAASGVAGITGREIEGRIGRSREHTARMMNALYRKGLVTRETSAKPFTYMISDLGKKEAGIMR